MSVFADTPWSGPFSHGDSNPFGWDSVHNSSPFRGFGFGSGGLFENDRGGCDDALASKMRFRSAGPTLAERGFYDHFDSIFHDLSHGSKRRYDISEEEKPSRRQSSQNAKGREYVIPIRIERADALSPSHTNSAPSRASPKRDSLTKRTSTSGDPIEIPIIRETSTCSSHHRGSSAAVPSHFKLLTRTPIAEENRRTNSRPANHSGEITPRKSSFSDIEVIEVEEEEETRTTRRRTVPRHSPDNVISTTSSVSAETSSPRRTSVGGDASPKTFASSSNIRNAENVTIIDIKDPAKKRESEREKSTTAASEERRKLPCSSAGNIDVTPAPSYPIYDLLKPRLASIDRQLDYIRGDGNCFFRALSKEMYGSENFHAEWRQAVVDVIESHPHVFRQYIDGEDVARHVKDMRKAGTWATSCEIYAAATLLQREIYVLAPSPTKHEYNWLLFSPRPLPGTPSASGTSSASLGSGQVTDVHPCYLTLCYTNGNHYDRITPVFAQCNCEMPPPSLNGVSVLVDLSDEEEEFMDTR